MLFFMGRFIFTVKGAVASKNPKNDDYVQFFIIYAWSRSVSSESEQEERRRAETRSCGGRQLEEMQIYGGWRATAQAMN
jgi:hypothetical protein